MDNSKITILIPAYNPTIDLVDIVDNLIKNNFKVIVVDDGSKPETQHIFNKLNKNIIFLKHPQNMGKGQTLKTGFNYINKNVSCVGVITADADGQHAFEDILKIANTLKEDSSSLILGSRLETNKMLLRSRFGNTLTRFVFKIATKTSVFDTQTGLRGIPFQFLEKFGSIEGQRYEYEMNMLLYCTQNKINIKEISIETIYFDDNKSSSFNVIKDSFKIYKCIIKNSGYLTSILYCISAILSFLIDFLLLFILYNIIENLFIKDISLLISVVIARIASSLFNFFFNRNIVFKDHSSIFKAIVKYYTLALSVLIINYLLLNVLAIRLSFNLAISKILVETIIFINNYFIQKIFIFTHKK